MSEQEQPLVSVRILDRSYRIKCPQEDATSLRHAAAYVDKKMRGMRQAGRVNSTDSMAVVVALNIAHELMNMQKNYNQHAASFEEQVMKITQHIDQTLAQEEAALEVE